MDLEACWPCDKLLLATLWSFGFPRQLSKDKCHPDDWRWHDMGYLSSLYKLWKQPTVRDKLHKEYVAEDGIFQVASAMKSRK